MSSREARSVPRVAAGILIAITVSAPASAQAPPKRAAPAPAGGARGPSTVGADQSPEELKARQDLARALQLARSPGREAEAVAAARGVLAARKPPAAGTVDRVTLQALALLTELHSRTGDVAAEAAARQKLLDALVRSFAPGDWRIAEARERLADAERRLASTPERRRSLAKAMDYLRRAIEQTDAGHLDEALPLAVQATELYRDVHGQEHRDVSNALMLRGLIHKARHEYAMAGEMFDQAIVLRRNLLGENHPDTLLLLKQMASLAEARGDIGAATRLFECAAELDLQNAAAEDAVRAELLETIGAFTSCMATTPARGLTSSAPLRSGNGSHSRRRAAVNPLGGFRMGGGGPRLGGGFSPFDHGFGIGRNRGRGMIGGLGMASRRARTTRARPSRFGFASDPFGDSLIDIGMGDRPMFGSKQADDNMAMVHNPSHPWTLRLCDAHVRARRRPHRGAAASNDHGGV